MATIPKTAAPASPLKDAAAPKRLRDMIMTTTPVVLTVVATVLAGISSSEMTQAQYYRSLAAQNQAKVADQWSFFQAKRTRRMIGEKTLDLYPDVPSAYHARELQTAAGRLVAQLEKGRDAAAQLVAAIAAAGAELGPARQPLERAAGALQERAAAASSEARAAAAALDKTLARTDVKDAFHYLETRRQPEAEQRALSDPGIEQAVQAVLDRRPEADMAPLMGAISPEQLRQAVETTEANIKAYESLGKTADQNLGRVDQLVSQGQAAAHAYHRAAEDLTWAMADLPADKPAPAAVRRAAEQVARADQNVQRLRPVVNDYKAAREAYTARRNRGEADRNQQAAALYEVEVHKNSVTSERHQKRSRQFFFAMLCAQAGVALASLALLGHYRGVLWTVALMAGLSAIVFGGQVYLGP
jgi:hypothetical protein